MKTRIPVLVDPLALLLSHELYIKIHLPDPVPSDFRAHVLAGLKSLPVEERAVVAQQAKMYVNYYSAIEAASREVT